MKRLVIIIIIIIGVALLGYAVFAMGDDDNQDTNTTDTTQNLPPEDTNTTPSDDTSNDNDNAVTTDEVEIEDMAFSPATITVKKGTTVTWTNKDSVQHTVTPNNPTAEFAGSELLSKDASYSVTFNTVGTFSYHCQPHPQMTGTVTVTE